MRAIIVSNNNERSHLAAERVRDLFLAAGDEAAVTSGGFAGDGADICVVVGGDGAVLHVGKEAALKGVPVLALNTGRVGFLTTQETPSVLSASALLESSHRERRMLLEVEVVGADGSVLGSGFALNEAVVSRGGISRIIDIEVAVDGRGIYTVRGDGVIIATPTGSTAYSMSAGGPIVAPEVSSVIVTPVCPYTLTARSVVLPDSAEVSARVVGLDEREAMLTVDGAVPVSLREGDSVVVRRSEKYLELLTPDEATFYEKIKTKLFGKA